MSFSLTRMASFEVVPTHGMNAHSTFRRRELAFAGRRTVRDNLGLLDLLAFGHQRSLVQAGVPFERRNLMRR